MRITRDEWAMRLAETTALRATCLRRSVGCILLNDKGHVLATVYNGVPAGMLHCNEGHPCEGATSPSGTNLDACHAIHAEQNALLQCKDVYQVHTAYVTVSPCITCVKLLLNSGCQRIVFRKPYPHTEARDLWVMMGRQWMELPSEG